MTRTLYIIGGANGSGKTTLARELIHEDNLIFLNADELAAAMNDNIGIQAGKVLINQMNALFDEHKSFVLESTIAGKNHLRAIKRAQKEKYDIVFVYVFLDSVQENISRIQHRVKNGGHNIATHDVIRRYKRSLQNFQDVCDMVKYWELYYNGGKQYKIIAHGTPKTLEIFDSKTYDKFKETIKDA